MKKEVNLLSLAAMVLIALSIVFFSGCKKDEADPVAPIASFQFVINEDNKLEVTFTNYSKNATSYSWDFGDGIGTSTEENPTYTYTDGGVYNVILTATSEVGSKDHSKEVKPSNPAATNFILNGGFDDDSFWTITQHNASGNGIITIADGVAVFDEVIDVPSGDWGNEAHIGLNQHVTLLEAGAYQLDMDITTNGIDECWFEVWVGLDEPVDEADYNEANNATKVLSFNSWDCPDNKVYSGPMAVASCQDVDGSISLDAGSYYVVLRSGGFTFGEGGIIIDNVSMVKQD